MVGIRRSEQHPRLLVVEDDADDFALVKQALDQERRASGVRWVKDGEELMQVLRQGVRPDLILLDLNMPRKDGREALEEIKNDSDLRKIPVVVLTTSGAEEDVERVYELGANSFIRKPDNFEEFMDLVRTLNKYWFEIVQLPGRVSQGVI